MTLTPVRASVILIISLLTLGGGSVPSAQTAATWRIAATLAASNAGEDDHLGAGNALTGVGLALSRDGRTLAVGAPHEDSAARGINGNQRDDSAFDSGAVYVFAQTGSKWVQQGYLKASNAASGDQFGFAVALSGDGSTLAVAANFEDSVTTGINGNQNDESASGAGAVYVFVRNGAAWSQQAYIKSSNAAEGDRFGYALALSDDGSTLSVGAIGEDSVSTGPGGNQADNSAEQAGATYVFTRSGGAWTQQAYLKASNTQAGDMFGFCVAMSGDGNTLGVCAYDEDSSAEGIDGDQKDNSSNGSGAAYVFVRSGSLWRQQAYVKASNTTLQGAFGASIALSGDGDTLAICAVDEDGLNPGVGAVPWQAERKAAERTRIAEDSAGAVYVYGRSGTTWSFQTYIKSSNIRSNDYFGARLALNRDGTILAAGAPQQPGGGSGVNPASKESSAPESGAVYVFARSAGRWSEEAYVKAPDAEAYDQFGSGVALSGDGSTLAISAMGEDGAVADGSARDSVRDSGAVHLYLRSN
jgi:hypothetical protein